MKRKGSKKNVSILVLLALIGASYVHLQQKQEERLDAKMKGMAFGKLYGRMIKQSACVPALRVKHAQCKDSNCELSAQGYISECLRTAEPDNFCGSVPAPQDREAALAWADRTCNSLRMVNTKCTSYIQKAVSVCYEQNIGNARGTDEHMADAQYARLYGVSSVENDLFANR